MPGQASTDSTGQDAATQTVPTRARCVIIGAGIVGNCLVGHLSRLGWTDMVQIDKGPLPNPGGSTGHASNFIFPTDHNKEMAFLTLESQRQYIDHGLNNTSGDRRPAGREGRWGRHRASRSASPTKHTRPEVNVARSIPAGIGQAVWRSSSS